MSEAYSISAWTAWRFLSQSHFFQSISAACGVVTYEMFHSSTRKSRIKQTGDARNISNHPHGHHAVTHESKLQRPMHSSRHVKTINEYKHLDRTSQNQSRALPSPATTHTSDARYASHAGRHQQDTSSMYDEITSGYFYPQPYQNLKRRTPQSSMTFNASPSSAYEYPVANVLSRDYQFHQRGYRQLPPLNQTSSTYNTMLPQSLPDSLYSSIYDHYDEVSSTVPQKIYPGATPTSADLHTSLDNGSLHGAYDIAGPQGMATAATHHVELNKTKVKKLMRTARRRNRPKKRLARMQ